MIPNYYDHDKHDDKYEEKVTQRKLHPRPLIPPEADDSAQRFYNLHIPSWKVITNNYERDDDDE